MLEEVVGHVDRVEIVPPGVDVDEFRPEPREEALAALLEEARADPPNPGNRDERLPDEGNAERFARFFADERPTVVYFGKLIENKGVQVLLEAIAGLDARAVVVGFGDFREQLEALAPLGTLFTGALEHRHLRHLLPLCDVAVVPSIFPEAFGMVAAEAAAAGVLPVVSAHSGLAEVAAGIGEEVGPEAARAPLLPGRRRRRAARAPRGDPRAARRAQALSSVSPPAAPSSGAGAGPSSPRACCPLSHVPVPGTGIVSSSTSCAARFNCVSRLSRVGEEQRVGYEEMLALSRESFDAVPDFTVAVEEEFALLDPETLDLVNRFEELQEAALGTALEPHLVGELIASRSRSAPAAATRSPTPRRSVGEPQQLPLPPSLGDRGSDRSL